MSSSDRNIQQVHGVATPDGQADGHRPARGSENPAVGTIYPIVVVLGATGKVGRGIVQALVDARRPLVAVADDSRELAELVAAHGGADLTVLPAKIAADADAERLVQDLRGLGRVVGAVVVPFACEGGRGRVLDHPTSLLGRALEQDVLPQLALARQLVPVLTTLVSLDPVHVYFEADEQAYLRYDELARRGEREESRNPVRVGLANEDGYPHAGTVDFVDNQVDPATGTIRARAVRAESRSHVHAGSVRAGPARGHRPASTRC